MLTEQLQPEHNPMRRNPAHFQLTPARELLHRLRSAVQRGPTPGIRLVDVSRYQVGPISYAAMFDPANAGYMDGIVVKATEGTGIVDSLFTQHWQGARPHAPVMVYHFFRGNLSGTAQADFLLSTIQPLLDAQGSTVVWLDIESSDGVSVGTRVTRAGAFLAAVDAELPGRVGFYSSPALWSSLMVSNGQPPPWTGDYWGWVAHWTGASSPTLPLGWNQAQTALWQYGIWDDHSWVAAVPGIQPRVDVNKGYFDSRAELAQFVGISAPPPPPPPDPDLEARVTALEMRLANDENLWAAQALRLASVEQVAADHEARITALEDGEGQPPPTPGTADYVVTDDKTLANYERAQNGAGYSIMAIWEGNGQGRIRWDQGTVVTCYTDLVRSDGGKYWLKVKPGPNGGHLVPSTPDLYVLSTDVTPAN